MQHELGWEVLNCYDEWSGGVSNQGRDGKREVALAGRLKPVLKRLNSELPVEAIEGAVEGGLGGRRFANVLRRDATPLSAIRLVQFSLCGIPFCRVFGFHENDH